MSYMLGVELATAPASTPIGSIIAPQTAIAAAAARVASRRLLSMSTALSAILVLWGENKKSKRLWFDPHPLETST
jgi:hypothetical protein